MRAAGIPHEAPPPAVNRTARWVHERVLPAALALLPAKLESAKSRVMLMTIGLQESRFEQRRQVQGPARGFWQFEEGGGMRGVLEHHASKPLIESALEILQYRRGDCFEALPHNDVLACVFARLLLWTHPGALPASPATAWAYYLATWRPGKPHPETWEEFYRQAWTLEEGS